MRGFLAAWGCSVAASVTLGIRRVDGYTVTLSPGVVAGPRFGTPPLNGSFAYGSAKAPLGIEQLYRSDFTLAPSTAFNVDLLGGTGEVDTANIALAMSQVRWIYLELTTPGLLTSLRLGPRGVTNGWQGPWGGVGASNYATVPHIFDVNDGYDLWAAVGAGAKILSIYNPGLAAVAGTLLVAGTKV